MRRPSILRVKYLIWFTVVRGGTGAGVESMTFGGVGSGGNSGYAEEALATQDAKDCLIPMGITSENVASDYGLSREVQDEFAAKSFQKAAAASKAGRFRDEIVPMTVKSIDAKTGKISEIVVAEDDGIRDGVTAQSLAKLKPAFKKDGSTHAGTPLIHTILRNSLFILILQETHPKFPTAPLRSSLPAVPSPYASGCQSSANSSPQLPSASLHASWVSGPPTPSHASSPSPPSLCPTLTSTKLTKRSRPKRYSACSIWGFRSKKST